MRSKAENVSIKIVDFNQNNIVSFILRGNKLFENLSNPRYIRNILIYFSVQARVLYLNVEIIMDLSHLTDHDLDILYGSLPRS